MEGGSLTTKQDLINFNENINLSRILYVLAFYGSCLSTAILYHSQALEFSHSFFWWNWICFFGRFRQGVFFGNTCCNRLRWGKIGLAWEQLTSPQQLKPINYQYLIPGCTLVSIWLCWKLLHRPSLLGLSRFANQSPLKYINFLSQSVLIATWWWCFNRWNLVEFNLGTKF